jgi:hypothetical protein
MRDTRTRAPAHACLTRPRHPPRRSQLDADRPLPPRLTEMPCRSPTSTPGLPRPPVSWATCVPRPRRRPLLCAPTRSTRGTARRAARRQA